MLSTKATTSPLPHAGRMTCFLPIMSRNVIFYPQDLSYDTETNA